MRYPGEKAIEDKIQEMLPFYADAYDLYFLNLFLNSHVSQHPVDEIELLFSEKTKIAKVHIHFTSFYFAFQGECPEECPNKLNHILEAESRTKCRDCL